MSQSPEFKEQRLRAFEVACSVYDQLAVCLARWGQLRLFHECLERGAIKFSFDEPHTWLQYALSLLAIGENVHALRVLEEVHRLLPQSAVPCMLAAKTCYLHLKDHEEGIMWSKRAIATKEGQPYSVHSARSHLLLGIGLYLRSIHSTQHITRSKLTLRAVDAMQKLLLTAQKQYQEALNLVVLTLDEWPDCLDLMLLQAHLEQLLSGPEAAKAVAIKMLGKWKILYEDQTSSSDHTNQSERRSESRSLFHLSETGSNPTQASRGMPNGMSESSLSSLPRRKSSGLPWDWLVRIWLLLGELCLHAGQRDQALKCIDEAQQIQPLTPDVLVARGMACEADGAYNEAKNYFESAISLEPNHLKGLQYLVSCHGFSGNIRQYTLGLALEAQGDHSGSADCMAVALDVENSSPLLPFTSVPLTLE
ncbi:hypothetical protein B566_EDAN014085 [Ephemera danica]|nr:hypothetical protein B566_EDAN014085 [Ephemera danica]